MQPAEVVLGVLRERGRNGLPCAQLYRQMFNRELYLAAYGKIYSNQGAMTPGVGRENADGMSEEKIEYARGKLRPLGMPTWSGKLAGEVVRLLLEAYYEISVFCLLSSSPRVSRRNSAILVLISSASDFGPANPSR